MSRLGQIQVPTLVMHGARDAMSPVANARLRAERIPDAELVLVAGAGHAYALERPRESLELMTRRLGSREPIATGLPIGALRTGASLLAMGAEKINGGRGDVAPDRRAA